jgi:hypothetical protein
VQWFAWVRRLEGRRWWDHPMGGRFSGFKHAVQSKTSTKFVF